MRTISFLLVWSLIGFCFAQDDAYHTALRTQFQNDYGLTGGTWMLTGDEQTNFTDANIYGGATTETFTPTGQDFNTAMRLTIDATGTSNPWDIGYINNNKTALQTGDRVLVSVWLRLSPGTGTTGKLNLFVEDAATFEKRVFLTAEVGDEWQQYLIPFESDKPYAIGTLAMGYHLAYASQTLEVAGLNGLNFAQTVALEDLPTQIYTTYNGSDPNAPWRPLADARIEQHRKADMALTILDQQGDPLANTDVRVVMTRHAFGFGSALNPRRLEGSAWNNPTYQAKIIDLDGEGHGFNAGVT
ncbi:MAG: hypothetical protein AAFV07_13345, partial [Bacteroidota bacterium]